MCSEQFVNSWSLAYHRKTRHCETEPPSTDSGLPANERKPWKCDYCEKRYVSQQSLLVHINLLHTGDSPGPTFQCDQCGKRFMRKVLQQHLHSCFFFIVDVVVYEKFLSTIFLSGFAPLNVLSFLSFLYIHVAVFGQCKTCMKSLWPDVIFLIQFPFHRFVHVQACPPFKETEVSLTSSQGTATGPYPKAHPFSLHLRPVSLKFILVLPSDQCQGVTSSLFCAVFLTKIM